ncbi:hypothetical protein BJV78DRAFT_1299756 [Lactifluus subvellereus]|nr:hypothetical protein BJV78DRAFT_1299756 [Lactifluus subvellereus]
MANNAHSTDSTQPEYCLGPSLSLAHGAPGFATGELVLVRIPEPIRIGGHEGEEATAGTNLPPTSNGSSRQHFAFIRYSVVQQNRSYLVEVYPVLAFSRSGGAIAGYNRMDDASRAQLLPLPSLLHRHPTPEAFGAPLRSPFRDSWLSVIPIRFIMPRSRPFKRMIPPLIMPFSVLDQIDLYRETLLPNPQTTNARHHDDQSYPPPMVGAEMNKEVTTLDSNGWETGEDRLPLE